MKLIYILCGSRVYTRRKPMSVGQARRRFRKAMDIRKEMVALVDGLGRAHGNTKLWPGDKVAFIHTHGTIG